jgi:sphingomyelin phosphodiesterase acid-like 3
MVRFFRCIVFLALAMVCLTGVCNGDTGDTYPVVVFSDVHFNPFYDEALFQSLVTSDASQWAGIFAKSNIKTLSAYGADTNYPLLARALSGIQQNLGSSPLVIYTGDVLGHNFAAQFFKLYGRMDISAMEAFADKTVSFFTQLVKSYVGNIPVMFVLGNADSYTGFGPGRKFLSNTADIFYTNWIGATTDQQEFLNTYKAGGYYSAQPLGANVMVIALNTFILSTLQLGAKECAVQAELAWLEERLSAARSSGKAVWLLMHLSPGMYLGETADKLTSGGHLFSASKILKPRYQARLLKILSSYSDIITMMLAGHTHMDEFRNIFGGTTLQAKGFLEITPGITPYFNNNPAFKIFALSKLNNAPVDYRSLNCDLAAKTAPFEPYYTFSTAYFDGLAHVSLDEALAELYPALAADEAKQGLFRTCYYSGNDSGNTITDANWKVYWCGIAQMTGLELIDCVNSY